MICTADYVFILLFQALNLYLHDKAYLAKNQFTLADILMYYGIQPVIVSYLLSHLLHPYMCSDFPVLFITCDVKTWVSYDIWKEISG